MNNIVRAFAPANISLVFKQYIQDDPRWSGSYGFGFTLSEGVLVSVKKAEKTAVFFNDLKVDIPTVSDTIQALTQDQVSVCIETKLPLGCGFGLSGASALAVAYAVNKLFSINFPDTDLAIIAHTQEVKNKTGLGDVTNQFFGGFLLKQKPSSYFSVKQLRVLEKKVYCKVFGPLATKSVLEDQKLLADIKNKATTAMVSIEQLLVKNPVLSVGKIFAIANQFVQTSGLVKDKNVKNQIEEIEKNGGHATMVILGNAVISDIPFDGSVEYFIANYGACLL